MGSLQSAAPAELDCSVAGPSFCISHFDRAGVQIPAVHIVEGEGFCSSCFRGRPIVSSRKSFVLGSAGTRALCRVRGVPHPAAAAAAASRGLAASYLVRSSPGARALGTIRSRDARSSRKNVLAARDNECRANSSSKEFDQTTYRHENPRSCSSASDCSCRGSASSSLRYPRAARCAFGSGKGRARTGLDSSPGELLARTACERGHQSHSREFLGRISDRAAAERIAAHGAAARRRQR